MHTVRVTTTLGSFTIELDDRAPKTSENFLQYVRDGFYDGTIFHRVIPRFMVQGGGYESGLSEKNTRSPVEHEGSAELKNLRGTIAMARTNDPHSASSQFFINTVNNSFLDHTAPRGNGWGYAVFGKVVEGMEVIDAIEKTPTRSRGYHDDVPEKDIIIEKMEVVQ